MKEEKKSKLKARSSKSKNTGKTKSTKVNADFSLISVYDSKGKEVEKFQLNKELFTGEVNKGVLYKAALMYDANLRRGTASTKTRGEVSGGGKKPWRQKGTGRARAGSTRSPLWRGGGKIFGPHPRDFHYTVPKKVLRLALLSSLNSKIRESKIIGIDSIDLKEPKTKYFQKIVDALKLEGVSIFITDDVAENLARASRNIEKVSVKDYRYFNTMDILRSDNVVISKPALLKLPERLKGL